MADVAAGLCRPRARGRGPGGFVSSRLRCCRRRWRADCPWCDWRRRRRVCWGGLPGASTGRALVVPCLMHGGDTERDRLPLGERVALLHAAQRLAAELNLPEPLQPLPVPSARV